MRIVLAIAALLAVGAAPNSVPKADWMKGMKTALPVAFCKPTQYFRQCFKVTAEECEQVALSTTRVCLENLKDAIPDPLKQPEDGTTWGAKVGQCAGAAYETALVKKKIQNDKCNDASAWTGQ